MSEKYAYGLGRPCEVCGDRDDGECMVLAGTCPERHAHALCTSCYRRLGLKILTETYALTDGRTAYRKLWLSCPDAMRVAAELMAEDQS